MIAMAGTADLVIVAVAAVVVVAVKWGDVLGQLVPPDSLHYVDHQGVTWPWLEVSMDELANAVAAVDRSGDR